MRGQGGVEVSGQRVGAVADSSAEKAAQPEIERESEEVPLKWLMRQRVWAVSTASVCCFPTLLFLLLLLPSLSFIWEHKFFCLFVCFISLFIF